VKPKIAVGVELIQDVSEVSHPLEGFLHRHRHRAKTKLSDGTRSDVYTADFIDRDPMRRDAVVVAVVAKTGPTPRDVFILLRRQVRYAFWLVTGEPLITEMVAGLIELPETPLETTIRELREEAGLGVDAACIKPLGLPYFVLPGTLTERLVPMLALIPMEALEPLRGSTTVLTGDGSGMEEGAELVVVSLEEALGLLERSPDPSALYIADAKTEIALRRVALMLERGQL
jgi:ADP-ribose pyrophosphatase